MREPTSDTAATMAAPADALPSLALFRARPVAVWLVLGLLIVIGILSTGLFFETVAPVADFSFQPSVQADSDTYWQISGLKSGTLFNEHPDNNSDAGALNSFGPVLQAKLFRTDLGVMLSNVALFAFALWIVGTMPEFDRGMFTLLLLLNPMLVSAIITLNKEIFGLVGLIVFVRYMTAKRYRGLLLLLALLISLGAHWQQAAVMLFLACIDSRISPFRNKPRAGIVILLLFFTFSYTVVYHIAPVVFAGLLAQAQGGRTIWLLDRIQGNFGFPLVVIPKILLNVMGRFITPWYFLHDYWTAEFWNWFDQIFIQFQELLTTLLLFGLLFTGKLKLRHAPVYLLAAYLILTAVNPMVQPRYEYPAYVLLCLEASRYFRFDDRQEVARTELLADNAAHA
jgi:hypothetical protein